MLFPLRETLKVNVNSSVRLLNMAETVKTVDNVDEENSVTMLDVLQEENQLEEDANAVLGASDDKNCTYVKVIYNYILFINVPYYLSTIFLGFHHSEFFNFFSHKYSFQY